VSDKIKEFSQSYFQGTRAELNPGDFLSSGIESNYADGKKLRHVYMTSNLNVAIWGAELATGERPCRIYVVEATGPIEDDPNVTNKRFPGNPTNSYRSEHPLLVVGEVRSWTGHSVEEIRARREGLEKLMKSNAQIID
jgi:rifampin ADP-ribosylating transferase